MISFQTCPNISCGIGADGELKIICQYLTLSYQLVSRVHKLLLLRNLQTLRTWLQPPMKIFVTFLSYTTDGPTLSKGDGKGFIAYWEDKSAVIQR